MGPIAAGVDGQSDEDQPFDVGRFQLTIPGLNLTMGNQLNLSPSLTISSSASSKWRRTVTRRIF